MEEVRGGRVAGMEKVRVRGSFCDGGGGGVAAMDVWLRRERERRRRRVEVKVSGRRIFGVVVGRWDLMERVNLMEGKKMGSLNFVSTLRFEDVLDLRVREINHRVRKYECFVKERKKGVIAEREVEDLLFHDILVHRCIFIVHSEFAAMMKI